MRRWLLIALGAWLTMLSATAQQLPVRADVVPYDDEDGIARLAYRESPYYMELSGSWKQRRTDSSIFYTKQLNVEKSWEDYLVTLNVRCGRGCRIFLNDRVVDVVEDSRLWNEVSLSKYLKYGKSNTLTIEALRSTASSCLEDTTIAVGLNGEPFLLFKSDPGIADYTLHPDYDAQTATGTLSVEAQVLNGRKKGKYYLEVDIWDAKGHQLDRMGRWCVFDNNRETTIVEMSRSWGGVEPWTAETPVLYTAVMRLRNDKMEIEEVVGTRFGFRRVALDDGLLKVNGVPIMIKGVTYGIEHTEGASGRQRMLNDVLTMKRNNINAVRTARYSPMDPYFYELCDKYGLYVVCDANLMPLSSMRKAIATDRDYLPLFERRVKNLYGKYKNYTSIIAWSLGNSKDNGICMNASYRLLKDLSPDRPVMFSGADYADNTDIIAFICPSVGALRQALAKPATRPLLLLASVSDGNFSALDTLWPMCRQQRSLQGGFVDVWPLTQVQMSELKNLYKPFDVSLSKLTADEGEFRVSNTNDFRPLGDYTLEYILYTNLRPNIIAGELPLVAHSGTSENVTLKVPQLDLQTGEELFIRFDMNVRKNRRHEWQTSTANAHVGTVSFAIPQNTGCQPLRTQIPSASIDTSTQVPILQFVGHSEWQSELIAENSDAQSTDAMYRYTLRGSTMCDVRITTSRLQTGDITVDYHISPAEHLKETLSPQLSFASISAGENDTLLWFGLDRETFLQRNHSGVPGTYQVPMSVLRGSSRKSTRWCAVQGRGYGLYAAITDTCFTVLIKENGISLLPPTTSFRLHLRKYTTSETLQPQDFYTYKLPESQSRIPDPPVIMASAPRFSQPLTITLSTPRAPYSSQIHYTLDGSDPTELSPLYTGPITITTTSTIKARTFAPSLPPSFPSSRTFNYDYIVKTKYSRKPSTPYNQGADTLLFDGIKGDIADLSNHWLGFSGKDLTTTIQLAKAIDIDYIVLRYAHVPETWAFAPQNIVLTFSPDGSFYSDTVTVTPSFDVASQDNKSPQIVELRVPVSKNNIGFINIHCQTITQIPSWHRAKGLKPWLLMDEIEVAESKENHE